LLQGNSLLSDCAYNIEDITYRAFVVIVITVITIIFVIKSVACRVCEKNEETLYQSKRQQSIGLLATVTIASSLRD